MYVRIALVLAVLAVLAGGAPRAEAQECAVEPVSIVRWWSRSTSEEARLVLVTCAFEPNLAALDELSILARPHGTDRPAEITRSGNMVAPGIARLDPELLVRLQAIADAFPGKRIEIVSGYRPRARRTSRHRTARALDVRVEGVDRETLSDFLRDLPETGVGYYPNSHFTHVDVREESAFWIDTSGPGERAAYRSEEAFYGEVDDIRREILATVDRALSGGVADVDVDRE